MNKIRLQLLFVIALALSGTVSAKCPTGTVTVRGRVDNLPSGAASAEVAVVLKTQKGSFLKTASISDKEFAVEVPFSTLSSSILGSDRCHNLPIVVEVKVVAAGTVYAQKPIRFRDRFEIHSPLLYRLKQDLSIDILKETGNSVLRPPHGHSVRG